MGIILFLSILAAIIAIMGMIVLVTAALLCMNNEGADHPPPRNVDHKTIGIQITPAEDLPTPMKHVRRTDRSGKLVTPSINKVTSRSIPVLLNSPNITVVSNRSIPTAYSSAPGTSPKSLPPNWFDREEDSLSFSEILTAKGTTPEPRINTLKGHRM